MIGGGHRGPIKATRAAILKKEDSKTNMVINPDQKPKLMIDNRKGSKSRSYAHTNAEEGGGVPPPGNESNKDDLDDFISNYEIPGALSLNGQHNSQNVDKQINFTAFSSERDE